MLIKSLSRKRRNPTLLYLVLISLAILGMAAYLIDDMQPAWLIGALLAVLVILVYQIYRDKKYQLVLKNLLEQLSIEILDTGVIIFDMHNRSINCSLWIPSQNRESLSSRLFSSNAKYGHNIPLEVALSTNQALKVAVSERAQVYERPALDRTEPQAIVKLSASSLTRLGSECDWRLITPVIDAIDRLQILAILVIEGKGSCEVTDINKLGLDKAAGMIAFQLCEILSVSERMA